MKVKLVLSETICLILALNFFYEGLYKLTHLDTYSLWLGGAIIIKKLKPIFIYLVPAVEIILAIFLLFSRHRVRWLYLTIGAYIIFIVYIVLIFQIRSLLLYPYHALWPKPTWIQVITLTLFLSWLAFMASLHYESKNMKKNILAT